MIVGDRVTHLDSSGCPTTDASIVIALRGREAILLEPDGSMPHVLIRWCAPWVPTPPGYRPPAEKPMRGINRFGFLRGI